MNKRAERLLEQKIAHSDDDLLTTTELATELAVSVQFLLEIARDQGHRSGLRGAQPATGHLPLGRREAVAQAAHLQANPRVHPASQAIEDVDERKEGRTTMS